MTGCKTDSAARKALSEAAVAEVDSAAVSRAIAMAEAEREANARKPKQPAICRARVRSGVRRHEPLDKALERTDFALGEANDQKAWCADWNERREGLLP